MPLPPAAATRQLKHTRNFRVEGYARDDGLWDIEARITDYKTRDLNLPSGTRPVGETLHDMSLRLTIDDQMNIVDAMAVSDAVPYPGHCESITGVYRQLIGLNLFKNFRQDVRARFSGVDGCTHITELTNVLPTVAVQTFGGDVKSQASKEPEAKPFQLDRCHALASHGEVARLHYPQWYVGPLIGPLIPK